MLQRKLKEPATIKTTPNTIFFPPNIPLVLKITDFFPFHPLTSKLFLIPTWNKPAGIS